MNADYTALIQTALQQIVAEYTDFDFYIRSDSDGNLTLDYRGKWQPEPEPDACPFLTIGHDGSRYHVSHYRWNDYKRYKTTSGAARYIDGELKKACDCQREQKAKNDAEREYAEKSVQILKNFHAELTRHGIQSKLCLASERHTFDHLNIEAVRINTDIDLTVSRDFEMELSLPYRTFRADRDAVIDLIFTLAKKGTA